ncbi:glycosyltransferase family 4 protein [Intrasporangium flavum]|uniref:glycosyltransferase family 4 protein n=1 Tax=Intrasporangium flavum TaxID=1428657 RepID=UPI001A95757F|nr:glycosyltransferase family 4 protein [Intrasporangium flavum]
MPDRPAVAVLTEQQCSLAPNGEILGRTQLGALESLAAKVPCTLVARVGRTDLTKAPESGVPLLQGAHGAALPWSGPASLISLIRGVWRQVGRHEVVVVYLPGLLGVVGGATARLRRRRLVVIVVGNAAQSVGPDVVPGWRGVMARSVLHRGSRWLARRADVARYVTTHALQGVYPAGPRTRSVAASDVRCGDVATQPRRRPDGPVRLLTVASMDQPYKGVPDLVDAVARVRDAGGDLTLRVAGTGRLRASIESQVAPRGGVEFLGHLSGQALRDAYADADAFALASWTEGMPRALVEAMSAGLPTVATDVGGVSELLGAPWVRRPKDIADLATGLGLLLSPQTRWSELSADNIARAAQLRHAAARGDDEFVAAVTQLLEDRS